MPHAFAPLHQLLSFLLFSYNPGGSLPTVIPQLQTTFHTLTRTKYQVAQLRPDTVFGPLPMYGSRDHHSLYTHVCPHPSRNKKVLCTKNGNQLQVSLIKVKGRVVKLAGAAIE